MDIRELVQAILDGDLLTARQFVADANRAGVEWSTLAEPHGLNDRAMCVAAGIVELFALRAGAIAPDWTRRIGAAEELLVLDPGLESMPRSFARARATGPEPLRRRNMVALPDFLDVA